MFEEFINESERDFFNYSTKILNRLNSKKEYKEERKFKVLIKNVETVVTVRFDEDGYPVYYSHKSDYVPSESEKRMNELLLVKRQALKEENYKRAWEVQEEINKLKNQ